MDARKGPLKLAIAGLGAIGLPVARSIDAGNVPGLALVAVSVRDEAKARKTMAGFRHPPRLLGLAALADAADVIVECLPSKFFLDVAEPAIARGRIFMPLSVGALIDHMHLVDLAAKTGARIVVPTGALLGLDAVRATAEGKITSATIVTRKPPAGLAGAPLLVQRGLSVDGLKKPLMVFAGSAREAASPPTSTYRWPCRSPASVRTGPGSRSGPTPASPAIRTPSPSDRIPPTSP